MTASLVPSYYENSANPRPGFPRLSEHVTADVCVIGAGYTGLSAALELEEKGFSVVLLEAERVGFGASGRNGGQIATGYSPGMIETKKIVGRDDAVKLWKLSEEASRLLRTRISQHGIKCDLKQGELYAAMKPGHQRWLREEQELCERQYQYHTYRWVAKEELAGLLATDRYCGALYDSAGGHLHPLNYALGLAEAARAAGVAVYERTKALAIAPGAVPVVTCAGGTVTARHVVLAGNAYLGDLDRSLAARIIPVSAFMIATAPLGPARARELMRTEACVADTDFNLDYFRMSADHRLLYGGRDYAGRGSNEQKDRLRLSMLKTFPQLADVKIDFAWGGKVAVTRHRLPDIGRIGPNVYYAHGYSGQGLPLSGIAGKVMSEAIAGDAGRFDVFARIPHKAFPGGTALRVPLLSLAMFYYRLRDLL